MRNHQRQGLPLDDNVIREKARFFATTVGSADSQKLNSTNWLEKFKQKNHLMGAKSRKGSFNESEGGAPSLPASGSQTPSGVSPISPLGLNASISPLSPSQSRDNLKAGSPDSYMDLASSYKHGYSQSGTSLTSGYTETTAPSSFSPQSPVSPFFPSDMTSAATSASPFLGSQSHPHLMPATGSDPSRPRRQTFPQLESEDFGAPHSVRDGLAPKHMTEMMANSATPLGHTPIEEFSERSVSIASGSDATRNSPIPGTNSPLNMAPPPNPASAAASAHFGQGPLQTAETPSQDEARRALELVMHFFQHQPSGVVDPQEYITMGKLMEKLKVQGSVGELPGGMHSIDLGSHEVSHKRSIHSL